MRKINKQFEFFLLFITKTLQKHNQSIVRYDYYITCNVSQ